MRYTSQDTPPPISDMAAQLAEAVAKKCADEGTDLPVVSFEPGRAVVGPAVFTLYSVGTVKGVETEDGPPHVCRPSMAG